MKEYVLFSNQMIRKLKQHFGKYTSCWSEWSKWYKNKKAWICHRAIVILGSALSEKENPKLVRYYHGYISNFMGKPKAW